MKCPGGHELGTAFGKRKCTKLVCADKPTALSKVADVATAPTVALPEPLKTAAVKGSDLVGTAADTGEDDAELAARTKLFLQRTAMAGAPSNLSADQAVEWSQKALAEMLPEAVAQMRWTLRFGTDKQRDEMAAKVLAANGLDKKEATTGGGGTFILNLGTSLENVPFLKRVVDAQKGGK